MSSGKRDTYPHNGPLVLPQSLSMFGTVTCDCVCNNNFKFHEHVECDATWLEAGKVWSLQS